MHYIYVNDQFLPADLPFITADDRSLRFGDGIFETVLIVRGQCYNLPSHLERLQRGLDYFRIKLDISMVSAHAAELIAKNKCEQGYLRIVVSRGESAGVGYLPKEAKPYYFLQTVEKPLPSFKAIDLSVSTQRAHLYLPCKTNSAMLYTLAMLEAEEQGCENALILSHDGYICETASGNIFWLKDGVLYTPEEKLPFVPGTIRRKVIELSPVPVRQGSHKLVELSGAEEIFMSNVGGLITPVKSIQAIGFESKNYNFAHKIYDALKRDIVI